MILKKFPPGSDLSGAAVVTHSSGNHAQALALAARQRGVSAHIVMPEGAPELKIAAVREYGGNIVFCDNTEEVGLWVNESLILAVDTSDSIVQLLE